MLIIVIVHLAMRYVEERWYRSSDWVTLTDCVPEFFISDETGNVINWPSSIGLSWNSSNSSRSLPAAIYHPPKTWWMIYAKIDKSSPPLSMPTFVSPTRCNVTAETLPINGGGWINHWTVMTLCVQLINTNFDEYLRWVLVIHGWL